MKDLSPTNRETRARIVRRDTIRLVIFLLIISIIPALFLLKGWLDQSSLHALGTLKPEDVSHVTVSGSSKDSAGAVLASFDTKSDGKLVVELVSALHRAIEHSYSREDIGPRTLLMELHLSNGQTMQLAVHRGNSCTQTVYIDIIKNLGSAGTLFFASAESDAEMNQWFQETKLAPYLGCP